MKIYKPNRDPNKPKRPLSAYFRFMSEFRKEVADKGLSVTEIAKLGEYIFYSDLVVDKTKNTFVFIEL